MWNYLARMLGLGVLAVTGCQTARPQPMRVEVEVTYHHQDGEVAIRLAR